MNEKNRNKTYPRIWRSRDSKLVHIENMLGKSGIKLKLTATREDWHLLSRYFLRSIEKAEYAFHESFIYPMVEDREKILRKSLHNNHEFVVQMQSFAAVLYLLFEYFFQEPDRRFFTSITDDSYAYLRQNVELISSFSKPFYGGYSPFGSNSIEYAAYSMQAVFGSLMEDHKIVPFFDVDGDYERDDKSFQWTYIDGGLLHIHRWVQRKASHFHDGIFSLYYDVLPELKRDHAYNVKILSFFENLMDAILSGIDFAFKRMERPRTKKSKISKTEPKTYSFRPFYKEQRLFGFSPKDEKHDQALGLYFLLDEVVPDIFFHSRIMTLK